ncbi:hypothetical protein [Streptomyces sp. NPDC052015]|uniref:hypothetical protein n=1 Tax=Streptomyces sp. NPDC052015 TaxID=3154755 RepID=UPI00341F142C
MRLIMLRRRGERFVRPPDADSAGAGDVVGVLEVGEIDVRLGDGFGMRLLLLVLGECAVDARDAGGLALALAGRDDQVGLDLFDQDPIPGL